MVKATAVVHDLHLDMILSGLDADRHRASRGVLQGVVQRLLSHAVEGFLHCWLETDLTLHQQACLDVCPALDGINSLLQSAHQPFLLKRRRSQLVD